MTDQIRLTGSEYRLLDYLRDPDKPRVLTNIAEAVGCHYTYASKLITKLSDYGLVTVEHGTYRRLSIAVVEDSK